MATHGVSGGIVATMALHAEQGAASVFFATPYLRSSALLSSLLLLYFRNFAKQSHYQGIIMSDFFTPLSIPTSISGRKLIGLIEPFYTYHIFQVERCFGKGTHVTYLPLFGPDRDYAPNWELLEKEIPHLDLVLCCNPSNPTGKVWKQEEMQRLVKLTKVRLFVSLHSHFFLFHYFRQFSIKLNTHLSPLPSNPHPRPPIRLFSWMSAILT